MTESNQVQQKGIRVQQKSRLSSCKNNDENIHLKQFNLEYFSNVVYKSQSMRQNWFDAEKTTF